MRSTGSRAISTEDDYVRPDLPDRRGADERDDYDHRRPSRNRYDMRYAGSQDEDHLRILAILYYVLGGLSAFGGFFPLIYVFLGFLMLSGEMGTGPGAPPPALGWLFIVFASGFSLFIWALAACLLMTGYNLSQKKKYMFCFVVACLCCIQMPLGTILGVFTIIVLLRPTVKELFERGTARGEPAAVE